MKFGTGITLNEHVVSFDKYNNPVTGTSFDVQFFKDENKINGISYNVSLIDEINAIYNFSWSASNLGNYQIYIKNNITDVIYMSDIYQIVSDEELSTSIYVGI